jgi:hypothetical protein
MKVFCMLLLQGGKSARRGEGRGERIHPTIQTRPINSIGHLTDSRHVDSVEYYFISTETQYLAFRHSNLGALGCRFEEATEEVEEVAGEVRAAC